MFETKEEIVSTKKAKIFLLRRSVLFSEDSNSVIRVTYNVLRNFGVSFKSTFQSVFSSMQGNKNWKNPIACLWFWKILVKVIYFYGFLSFLTWIELYKNFWFELMVLRFIILWILEIFWILWSISLNKVSFPNQFGTFLEDNNCKTITSLNYFFIVFFFVWNQYWHIKLNMEPKLYSTYLFLKLNWTKFTGMVVHFTNK